MPAIDVHVLHLADLQFPAWHPNAGQKGLVNGFLVVTPEGPLLVDSGIGPPHPLIDEMYRPDRYDLDEALKSTDTGISRRDIVAIANSHLHFDHCGGNQLFPGTPIYTQSLEYRSAQEANYTIPEWINFPDANYELVEGRVEVCAGVTLLPTPGHSPGHQSVILDTDEGRVVLGGQVAEAISELSQTPEESSQSLRTLLDLDPQRIYLGHDETVWTSQSTETR